MVKKLIIFSILFFGFARAMEKGKIVVDFGSAETAQAFQYKSGTVFTQSVSSEIHNPAIAELVSKVERIACCWVVPKKLTWGKKNNLPKLLFEDHGVSKITIKINALTLAQKDLNMPKSSINCDVKIEEGSGKEKKIECIKGLEMFTNKLVG